MQSRRLDHTCIIMTALFPAITAHAQVHETDFAVREEAGRVVVGRYENGGIQWGRRVVAGTFGKFGIPNATSDPGFDSENGAFPGSPVVGLTIRRALRVWDGASFHTIADERLKIVKSETAITPVEDPPNCGVGESVALGKANANGKLHQHPAYFLEAPAETGVYLVEVEAWLNGPGQNVSDPFWILFNQNEPEDVVAAAFAWADERASCPADFDHNGSLDIDDFIAFQTGFALGDPDADFDGDCLPTIDDFVAFQTLFAVGCEF